MAPRRVRGDAKELLMTLRRMHTVLRVLRSMQGFGDVKLIREQIVHIMQTEIEHSGEVLREYSHIKEEE